MLLPDLTLMEIYGKLNVSITLIRDEINIGINIDPHLDLIKAPSRGPKWLSG